MCFTNQRWHRLRHSVYWRHFHHGHPLLSAIADHVSDVNRTGGVYANPVNPVNGTCRLSLWQYAVCLQYTGAVENHEILAYRPWREIIGRKRVLNKRLHGRQRTPAVLSPNDVNVSVACGDAPWLENVAPVLNEVAF